MMACTHKLRRGFSTMEYFLLMAILMGAFMTFKEPILRAIAGKWKASGDQFGQGRQFHPQDTVECAYDSVWTKQWYDVTCVDNRNCPPGNDGCMHGAILQCQSNYCTHVENE